ncbi:Glutaredoxin-related protein 5, mitochondrial [Holothuria leucospilota]|uniref:Glutaredoxin-related protein 5, mitochondrial n=1 Tax=Holothuria leucospilota TaxID=206669 RepID=A0A9Q1HDW1_HOLLE|nr:Glutaredoxin-related protein 5, mitochondrial [Holothuria leucospilota]
MNFLCRKTFSTLGRRVVAQSQQQLWVRCMSNYSTANSGSKEHIQELINKDDIVVFMKGVPEQPMCGFSNVVVQILRMHGVEKFGSHNVLDDDSLRQGIKEFSNWPTIPQVYFKGEFLGGTDIMMEMHQNGELIDELKKLGIRSALLDEEKE